MIINKIRQNLNRWLIWKADQVFRFVTVDVKPSWKGAKFMVDEECSLNNTKITYKTQKLFGTYYFLSTEMIEISYEVTDVIKMAASLAALAGALYRGNGVVARYINSRVILAKLIRTMYFV